MKFSNLLVSLLSFLMISCVVASHEYHVDCDNESKGDGSLLNPFRTITQAADIMVAGDVCYIHAGKYREIIDPKNSGSAEKPIVFTAFEDDVVIISATQPVKTWVKHADNIYKAGNVDMTLAESNNVFFEETKMQIARWPNDSDNDEYSLDAKYIDKDKETWSMSYISNDEIPEFDWTGGIIHYLGAHSGCSWERTITDYDPQLNRIHFATLPEKWPFGNTHSPRRMENDHRGIFYLMNKLEALDTAREWYYESDNKTLYFQPPHGNKPKDGEVEVQVRKHTAQINSNFILLDGLNFFGGMVVINGNNNTINNCMIKHGAERLITDLNGAAVSDAALQVNGNDNRIEKCVLENGSVNGITIANDASNNLVENNIVQYFNTIGIHALLLNSRGDSTKILKNSFYGSARDGVKVTGKDSEFAYNNVQKALISGADGGLFYVTGHSEPLNIELHHNWFHDAHADTHAGKKAAGIYLDNNSAGYIVHHNVVWNTEWGGLNFNWNALKNEIYNNTFWNIGVPDQSVINSWVPVRNGDSTNVRDNTLYNNITDVRRWWDSGDGPRFRIDEKEYMGEEADNDFQNNVQFANAPFLLDGSKNFMPYEGSPLIDKGIFIDGITDEYHGEAPDLGAYEYGEAYWTPGVDWNPENFAWKVGTDYLNQSIE